MMDVVVEMFDSINGTSLSKRRAIESKSRFHSLFVLNFVFEHFVVDVY